MSIVKVIEVISEGKTIDDAIANAVKEVTKTVKDVKQLNVDHIEAKVNEKGKVEKIRIASKVSFLVKN